jgi:glucokinase
MSKKKNLLKSSTPKLSSFFIAHIGVTGLRVALVALSENSGSFEIISEVHKRGRLSNKEEIFSRTIIAVKEVLKESSHDIEKLQGFMVTTPGPIDRLNKLVLDSPNMPWSNVEIEKEVRQRVPKLNCPIYLERDAISLTLAELYYGYGSNLSNFAVIFLGTGIGAGLVINGELYIGAHGQAGEMGHETINFSSTSECRCGHKGCLECFASGAALTRYSVHYISIGKSSELNKKPTGDIFYFDITDAASTNDKVALQAFEEMSNALSIGIRNLFHCLDLESVIISGPLSRASKYFLDKVKKKTAKNIIITDWDEDRIVVTKLENVEIVGGIAALLFQRNKSHKSLNIKRTSKSKKIV